MDGTATSRLGVVYIWTSLSLMSSACIMSVGVTSSLVCCTHTSCGFTYCMLRRLQTYTCLDLC